MAGRTPGLPLVFLTFAEMFFFADWEASSGK
jgi:hypothetical protein